MPTTTVPDGATIPARRTSIATKVAGVVVGLVLVLLGTNVFLLLQLRSVSVTYDRVLQQEIAEAQLAREMQVDFKKQVQEWKNVLLRGSDPEDLDTYRTNFEAQYRTVRAQSDTLVQRVTDEQARAALLRFRTEHERLQTNYEAALSGFTASDGRAFRAADAAVRGQDREPTDLLDGVVERLQAVVDARVAAQKADVAQRQQLLAVVGAAGVLALLVLLAVVVSRIVRPVRRLTAAARTTAQDRMPSTMARIAGLAADEQAPRLAPFVAGTTDELADLAGALTTMQDAVVDLAVEQRRRERETAEMLLNLGRRNQALLARVLSQLTELEREEQDPEVMAALFRIDHATTRVRRNAASMLVLAGAPPAPGRVQAVAVADVVRAAMSEIEDYIRVDLYHVQDATVLGSSATDLTHLLAELLENATHFSPPHTRVTVVGQMVGDGYRIRVLDQGIGMTREELDEANRRIEASDAGPGDARLLGLHVVGRLAARNRFAVRLEASADRGVTATVNLPPDVVAGLTGRVPGQAEPVAAESSAASRATRHTVVDVTAYDSPVPGPGRGDAGPYEPAVPAVASYPVGVVHEPSYAAPVLAAVPDRPATEAGRLEPAAVPVRVRGAGLARLGLGDDGRERAFAEAPVDSSVRLQAFQRDVDAARRALADTPDNEGSR